MSHRRSSPNKSGGRIGRFLFLDQTRFDVSSDVTVLGCALHSQVSPSQHNRVSFGLNGFYYIQGWTVENHYQEHKAELSWLNAQVSEPFCKIVIFTHHSPSTVVHAKSLISSGFSTGLSKEECWLNSAVHLWAFGHTHYNCDFEDSIAKKRIVTNQRGYYFSQAAKFDLEKVVSI